jgi:beta-carotene 3-hydroxylase
MDAWLLLLVGFAAMEPVTYAAHRWLMHGLGYALHRSHHLAPDGPVELNDAFPIGFAALTILAIGAGFSYPDLSPLIWLGAGVTTYGLAYAIIHDVYIHERFGPLPRIEALEYLREAHRIHHLWGGEPYGMLFPIVPDELWERAEDHPGDPLPRHRAS